MKKIPTLFVRDDETRMVVDTLVPGCEWVLAGEGMATRKVDGTCCLIQAGVLYRRRMLKPGNKRPATFLAAGPPDDAGRTPGWDPVGQGPQDRWHREGQARYLKDYRSMVDGTYELVGPKVQANPECYPHHTLVRHGMIKLEDVPTTFSGLQDWLTVHCNYEGVVWHHQDGRMAKIKCRDFGIERIPAATHPVKG